MCNLLCPVAASRVLVWERVCARHAGPRHTPCLPSPGTGMSQAAGVSQIFHPSRRRCWAGIGAGRSQDPAASSGLGGDAWASLPTRLLPAAVGCSRSRKGGARAWEWDSSCCFLLAGMTRSWWLLLNGRALSLQEGFAARLLQAPGCDQGWVLQPPARCISGAGSSPTGHLKVESRGARCGAPLRWCWAGEAALTLDPISFLIALMQGMAGEAVG